MTERTQRRLAAIVSADVVGYSRLMGADESFEQLLECRGKRRFRNISVRSAKLPYSKRVGLKEIIDGHRILLMCAVLHVIIENCLRTHYRMHVSPRAETNLVAPEASGNLFKTASITHRETE